MDILGHRDFSSHCISFYENAVELKRKAPEKFRSLFLMDERSINSSPVKGKFGWWVLPNNTSEFNALKLSLFHILLFNYEYMRCIYEEFEAHFIGDEIPKEKISWCGEVQILVLLFYKLQEKRIISIPAEGLYDRLIEHFQLLDKKTNTLRKLKYGSLKSSLSKAQKNPFIEKQVNNLIALLVS